LTAADVYRALWRHKLLIVVLTAVSVGATWYFTSQEAKTYEASTLLRVQLRSGPSGDASNALDTSQRLARTYAQVVRSGALTERVKRAVSRTTRTARVSSISVSADPVEDTELIWISARARGPVEAMRSADAAPTVLRSFIRETGRPDDQIVTVKKAGLPSSPVEPRLRLNVALALVLGLIFNGALALLIELIRDRMPETDVLGASLGYPVLATIPTVLRRKSGAAPEPTARRPAEESMAPTERSP
jgi:capsular polysaccharide biosynthesis protein